MKARSALLLLFSAFVLTSGLATAAYAPPSSPEVLFSAQKAGQDAVELAGSGKQNRISESRYFTWEFDRAPKMGVVVLKVKLRDADGRRVHDLDVTGRSDMPSMRGRHDSGEVAFKVSDKGDYLLPLNIVMPGEWEVVLTFKSGESVLLRGKILFRV
jgi:hypothetical protein